MPLGYTQKTYQRTGFSSKVWVHACCCWCIVEVLLKLLALLSICCRCGWNRLKTQATKKHNYPFPISISDVFRSIKGEKMQPSKPKKKRKKKRLHFKCAQSFAEPGSSFEQLRHREQTSSESDQVRHESVPRNLVRRRSATSHLIILRLGQRWV